MKVVAICGSARKGGNTEVLLTAVLEGAEKAGAETELITLCDKAIKMCDGCCYCDEKKSCMLNDDMDGIFAKMSSADAIILGSPTYWDNMTGLMKNFFDRLNGFCIERPLKGKRVGVVAVGGGGEEHARFTADAIRRFTEAQKMIFFRSMTAKAYKLAEISGNREKMTEAKVLGEGIVHG